MLAGGDRPDREHGTAPPDIRSALGLRPVINVSGMMTALGAFIVVPEAVAAVAAILPHFVEINDLQRQASTVIARLCGTEAGFVIASASDRLQVQVDPAAARITAWDLADGLGQGDPPVIVRDHDVEHGYFLLDPCNLHPGEEHVVACRLDEELEHARGSNEAIATPIALRRRRRSESLLRWPDA